MTRSRLRQSCDASHDSMFVAGRVFSQPLQDVWLPSKTPSVRTWTSRSS